MQSQASILKASMKFCGQSVKFSALVPNVIGVATSQYYGIGGKGQALLYQLNQAPHNNVESSITTSLKLNSAVALPGMAMDIAFSQLSPDIIAIGCSDSIVYIWKPGNPNPIVHQLTGHKNDITSLQWGHVCKNLILSGSSDKTIKLWDANGKSGIQPYMNLTGHLAQVQVVAWHPTHASILGSASSDTTFQIWDIRKKGAVKRIQAHQTQILSFDFNKYSNIVATGGCDNVIKLWDLRSTSKEPLKVLGGHELPVKNIKFSPFSELIMASCSFDMSIRIWILKPDCAPTLGNIFHHHTQFVTSCDFSLLDPSKIASVSWDKSLTVFNYRNE